MADFNRYIGVNYEYHGRDIQKGVDCFGLVKAVLENEFGRNFPDWREGDEDLNGFKKIDEPKIGCIALFKFAGVPAHIGIYIGEGRVLHVAPNETSVTERIDSRRLKDRLQGWYE
ncbi:hypothetical protein EOM86_07175 [Candidatus Nomurabacteria bacterium]|nr:hypothetical protein [Candidatus Nomurabacteria bacterium]